MALSIILICLGLHKYIQLESGDYQKRFCQFYFDWIVAKMAKLNPYGLLVVALLPVLLLVSLVLSLVHAVVGVFGYYILSVLLLWFCLDARALTQTAEPVDNLLLNAYQGIFALIFWFVLFGPLGLMFYFLVKKLTIYLAARPELKAHPHSEKLLALLDWVPIRVCGLSFALGGHFNQVLKDWSLHWRTGLMDSSALIQRWGTMALMIEPGQVAAKSQVTQLLYRTLLVWLVAIALVTIGIWFG